MLEDFEAMSVAFGNCAWGSQLLILLVGGGIGTRTRTGSGPSDITAGTPSPLTLGMQTSAVDMYCAVPGF